jgi:hypothetical protein
MREISMKREQVVMNFQEGIKNHLYSIEKVYLNVKSATENNLQSINQSYKKEAEEMIRRLKKQGVSEAEAHNQVDSNFGCDRWEAHEFEKGILEITKRTLLIYMYNSLFEKSLKKWLRLCPKLQGKIKVGKKAKKIEDIDMKNLCGAVKEKLGIDLEEIDKVNSKEVNEMRLMVNKIKHNLFEQISIPENDLLNRFPKALQGYFDELIKKTKAEIPSVIPFSGMIGGVFIPKR